MTTYHYIGQPASRTNRQDEDKVTGAARYTADLHLDGMLWGKSLRSPVPHALVTRIDVSKAKAVPGVHAVLTGDDVKGVLYGRRLRDVPVLAQGRVRFIGERVAAVAAESVAAAEEAIGLIDVAYEEIPAVFDAEQAMQPSAPVIHPDLNTYPGMPSPVEPPSNAYAFDEEIRGDVEAAFAQADVIVEETYTVQRVHQGYLEPHACIVRVGDDGRIDLWSPNKAPHGLKRSFAEALAIPQERVRVNYVPIGGDFGGKGGMAEEPLCYFLALHSRRPVKMVMSYRDELLAGAPRHAAVFHLKTGVRTDGTWLAHESRAVFDGGAYGGLRPGVNLTSAMHAVEPYKVPSVRMQVTRVYTNNLPGGQMRAPGEPQTRFAFESHVDTVARRLGMDPVAFRMRNLIEDGEATALGAHYEGICAKETLEAAVRHAGYGTAKRPNVGRGVAIGHRPPGGGESSVGLALNPDGSVVLHTAVFDQGTGVYPMLRQIVAEELSLGIADIAVQVWDTDSSSFDSGVGGSRVTRIATVSTYNAVTEARDELLRVASSSLGWPNEQMALRDGHVVRVDSDERVPIAQVLTRLNRPIFKSAVNKDTGRAPVNAFTAQVAEVAVDPETGSVEVLNFVTAHDTGQIMNPIGHQGQVNGAFLQGLGYARIEGLPVRSGVVGAVHLGDYKLPSIADIPPLETVLLQSPSGVGPYKVKGIGENPITPVAPAIANAIEDAVGVRIRDLPLTAESVLAAIKGSAQSRESGNRHI